MDDGGRSFLDGAAPDITGPKLPAHRPSDYTAEIASKICDAIAGGKKLREIEQLDGFPGRTTMFRWLREHPEFQVEYACAMQWRTESLGDEILDIADDKSGDYTIVLGEGENAGSFVLNKEALARSKQRIEVRQWKMAKEMPKKYGDLPAQELLPPPPPPGSRPGDNAKMIGDGITIENDPLHDQINAWRKARADGGESAPR